MERSILALLGILIIGNVLLSGIYVGQEDADIAFSLKFLWPLFFIVYLLYTSLNVKKMQKIIPSPGIYVLSLLIGPPFLAVVISFLFGSYLYLLNANIGPQETVEINGTLIYKHEKPKKGSRYYLEVKNRETGKRMTITVPLSIYESAKTSEKFNISLKKGFFNIVYYKNT